MKLTRIPSTIDISRWQIPSMDKATKAVEAAYTEILADVLEMAFDADDACVNFAGTGDILHFCFPQLTDTGDDLVFTASLREIVGDAIKDESEIESLASLLDTFRELTAKLESAVSNRK